MEAKDTVMSDIDKAIEDLANHRLPQMFSHRQCYFTGCRSQRDADVEHYEPLIEKLEGEVKAFSELADSYHKHLKQAHQDTAREFMKTIETMYPELRQVYWQGKGWQSLKEKYGVSKEVK